MHIIERATVIFLLFHEGLIRAVPVNVFGNETYTEQNIQKVCGIEKINEKQKIEDFGAMQKYKWSLGRDQMDRLKGAVITVKTHVFVVHRSNGVGKISQAGINKQLQIMKDAFEGKSTSLYPSCGTFSYGPTTPTPFRFDIVETKWIQNDQAFDMDSAYAKSFRAQYRRGDCSTMNIFVGDTNYLGFAWFPMWCANDIASDTVVINYQSVPVLPNPPYQGDTLVHEVGHWLGLFHTFEGGCSGGDNINDTPAEASPAFGCTIGRDTCPGGGKDPIHNYMDYSSDCCMYKFSSQQLDRMILQTKYYRGLGSNNPNPNPNPSPYTPAPSPRPTRNPTKTYQPPCTGDLNVKLYLTLVIDNYGYETAWTIRNEAGGVIGSGDGYAPNSSNNMEICLRRGNKYTFTIKDDYGDGICCEWGNGLYTGRVDNQVVFSGGQFGSTKSHSFSVSSGVTPDPTDDGDDIYGDDYAYFDDPDTNPPTGWTLISYDDFESGWGTFKKMGIDANRFIGSNINKARGQGSLFIQDNSGEQSSFESTNEINVASFNQVKVKFDYNVKNFVGGEDFYLEYWPNFNGGWKELGHYVYPVNFLEKSTWYVGEEILDTSSIDILWIRFRCDASSNRDKVFIDDVYINGHS